MLGIFAQNMSQFIQSSVSKSSIETNKIVVTPNIQLQNSQIEENKENNEFKTEEFYSGWYSVDNFKGMKEVWTILLSRDFENDDNQKLVWSAIVLTNNENDDFHSILININNNQLSFKTNKIRGVEYKFEGEFFKSRKLGFEDEELLRGTFQKLIKGKKVAEIKADFAYNEPKCWH